MSTEPTSVADIRYKCPVCYAALFPPVFQCQNGHLVCEKCIPKLKKCGICRASLQRSERVRNLEVERIIRITQHRCPNEDDGCNAVLKFEQIEEHRLACKYARFPICKNILEYDCEEEIRMADFAQHIETKHKNEFFDFPTNSLPLSLCRFMDLTPQNHHDYKGIFRFRLGKTPVFVMVTIQHDSARDLIKWKPYILADREFANQLCCKIRLSSASGEPVKVEMESPIFNLETDPEEFQACVRLPLKYLQTIFSPASVGAADAGKCEVTVEFSSKAGNLLNETADVEFMTDDEAWPLNSSSLGGCNRFNPSPTEMVNLQQN